jgi:hypothetical protein
MCSHIISLLEDAQNISPCYYFCTSLDDETVCIQIFRSIALQLLRQQPDLASFIAHQFVYQAMRNGMKQMKLLVAQILEILPCTRVVIDGLDECPRDCQKSVLKELQTLCFNPAIRLKILISSRREIDIRDKLSGKPHIELDERDEVSLDIGMYVRYKTTKLRTRDRSLLDRIVVILIKKADGRLHDPLKLVAWLICGQACFFGFGW